MKSRSITASAAVMQESRCIGAVPAANVGTPCNPSLASRGNEAMSVEQTQGPRIIVALDYAEPKPAMAMAEGLDPRHCRGKDGMELFTRGGPQWVRQLVGSGI